MRRRMLLTAGLLLLSATAVHAQGPRRDRRFAVEPVSPSFTQAVRIPTINLAGGGLAGGALGFFAFGLAGAYIADSQGPEGNEGFAALGGFVIGSVIGESVLLPLGVHIANRRQGDYGTALLASAGIAAVGIGLTSLMEDMAIVFLPAVPIGQLISSIAIERKPAN
jgi:hypothetical protein